jgi:hypothetical protein
MPRPPCDAKLREVARGTPFVAQFVVIEVDAARVRALA